MAGTVHMYPTKYRQCTVPVLIIDFASQFSCLNLLMDDQNEINDAKWLRSPTGSIESHGKTTKFSPISHQNINNDPSWLTPSPVKNHSRSSPVESVKSNNKRRIIVQSDDKGCCCGYFPSDPVLYWFKIFHIFSGLTGIATTLANAYVLTNRDLSFVNLVVHIYAIICCLLIIVAEIEWKYVLSLFKFLDYWVLRGLYYGFVGFLTSKLNCL